MKLANKYYYSLFNSIDNILSEYEWRDFIYFFFLTMLYISPIRITCTFLTPFNPMIKSSFYSKSCQVLNSSQNLPIYWSVGSGYKNTANKYFR